MLQAALLPKAEAIEKQVRPPLLADPGISQAAENHSRYWTLNPAPKDTLDYHTETAGHPGFTAVTPEAPPRSGPRPRS